MAAAQRHSPFGVGVIAFVLAVSESIGFYIFAYLPVITARPQIPEEILEPEKTIEILIIAGSADPEQEQNVGVEFGRLRAGCDQRQV